MCQSLLSLIIKNESMPTLLRKGLAMDLKQIEYIIKIADEKSITRAAEKLFLTQSALNQQLLRLEKALGGQLFKRTKSDWSPTPAGGIIWKAPGSASTSNERPITESAIRRMQKKDTSPLDSLREEVSRCLLMFIPNSIISILI